MNVPLTSDLLNLKIMERTKFIIPEVGHSTWVIWKKCIHLLHWLRWQDLNLRMWQSKCHALPLGDTSV